MTQYKEEITELFKRETITKLYFDNILIRENWTAIHYRFRSFHKKDITINVEIEWNFLNSKLKMVIILLLQIGFNNVFEAKLIE